MIIVFSSNRLRFVVRDAMLSHLNIDDCWPVGHGHIEKDLIQQHNPAKSVVV